MCRTLLNENNLPKYFWAEAINTSCYILNRIFIRPILKKTPYELWRERKPNIYYLHAFGCKCFIHNNGKDHFSKFDSKIDEGIFLGYSTCSRAFRCFNKITLLVEESMHEIFEETNPTLPKEVTNVDSLVFIKNKVDELNLDDGKKEEFMNEEPSRSYQEALHNNTLKVVRGHPHEAILGNPRLGVTTRSSLNHNYIAFFYLK
ncbi:hypothetical protein CFOL_v3_00977 [Cephalotus follicularis]|uniref:Retroviral polymerase SH3-like domain-containing protein n=1 Tax=Cephalotus follicularis TaxID=3775 RepID=A0A1Q3AP83_CEPFO|nr:hypothetical protein CFOL_v3_00977 [Cephalotus follicularis]